MIRTSTIALTAAISAFALVGQAHALTLTNEDTVEQVMQVTEGGDEAVTYDVVIAPDQTIDELCEEGCTITLPNGEQESFEGHEDVTIVDGQFVIAE